MQTIEEPDVMASHKLPEPLECAGGQSCDGIVAFAGVDWWYHPHGHSECQILSRLATRLPVLWVNSIGMRAPSFGKTSLTLTRYWNKIKSTAKFLRRDPTGMWVYSALFIPRYTERTIDWNGKILALQIRTLCNLLKIKHPAVWVTVPTAAPAVACNEWARVVFNRCDDFAAFPEADGGVIAKYVDQLLQRADDVLYVNPSLYETEKESVHAAHYLGHGVDLNSFGCAHDGTGSRISDIESLPRPIVGYYGLLDDFRIDLDLLGKVADHIAPATLLLIGPKAVDITRITSKPNVAYLGPVPHDALPACAGRFDVGIMPYLQNEWIAASNPIKLKEYLALAFPIVTTPFQTLKPYEELVYCADSHDGFLEQLDCALAEDDAALAMRRRKAVQHDDWNQLADRVAAMLRFQ